MRSLATSRTTNRTTARRFPRGLLALLLASSGSLTHAQTPITRMSLDGDSGLLTWEIAKNDVHVRLTQISPEQARGFMQARGLDEKSVNEFSRSCVYMTVLRNASKSPIKYCLAEWRYTPHFDATHSAPPNNAPPGNTPQTMLTKHDWLAKWKQRNLSKSVKLAFEWSQFPFEQSFAPGDWNQGMTTFELPAGSRFDLTYRWWQNDKLHEETLHNVQCSAASD